MAAKPTDINERYNVPQRFYERAIPEVGEVVTCMIVEVTDTAAYVHLIEYENRKGMIPFTELSNRRIRSINKHVKVGKQETVSVMRIDAGKGYIDLSKKQVTPAEKKKAEEHFHSSKLVMTIMRHLAAQVNLPVLTVMETIAWPLYRQYGHAIDAFKMIVTDPERILGPLNLDPKVRAVLEADIGHKMKPQMLSLRCELNATCCTRFGVDGVRNSLLAGRAAAEQEPKLAVSITIVAPPQYLILTQCESRELGLTKLAAIVDAIKTKLVNEYGGELIVEKEPHVVGDVAATTAQAPAQSESDDSD